MNKIAEGLLIFVAVMIMLLGLVFLMAGGSDNIILGAGMIVVSIVIFLIIYYIERIQATKPTLVSQTFNVKMDGSGKFNTREMKCKSCGAPIIDKDLKVIQGGIMVTCSYCGAMYALEEEPKW